MIKKKAPKSAEPSYGFIFLTVGGLTRFSVAWRLSRCYTSSSAQVRMFPIQCSWHAMH